ncbi:MAG TPA: hypothetical protein VK034_13855 [Enhygromyxa sp.]|nr:hypothetical protein [Enhygromyxa sp.]
MLRNTCQGTLTPLLAILATIAACEAEPSEPSEPFGGTEELRAGPRAAGDDIEPRGFGTLPNYRASVCPDGTRCTTIDFNHDGKEDLVRFDHFGIFAAPGTVAVAYSNGWNLGPFVPVLDDFCHQGDGCLAADVTGDGRPDLIRFVNGPKTQLWVAASKPDGFELAKKWSEGFCGPEQFCTAGDVTGDGVADLVAFGRHTNQGSVRVYPGGVGSGHVPQSWAQGFCTNEQALCRLGDVDGDGLADIVQFGREPKNPITRVARSTGKSFSAPVTWSGGSPDRLVCPAGADCQLGDFNGDWAADVIATFPEQLEADPNSCSGSCGGSAGNCWCDESCAQYGDCCADHGAICISGNTCEGSCGGAAAGCYCDELCTQYGDCCSDFQFQCEGPPMAREVQIWLSNLTEFGAVQALIDMACEPGDRCWTADFTGDGRDDLLTVHPSGLLELYASRDRVDRMLDAALHYGMMYTDHERRRQQWLAQERAHLLREMVIPSPELAAALPERFAPLAPAPTPTPSTPSLQIDPLPGFEPWPVTAPGAIDPLWMGDQLQQFATVVEAEATVLLDAVPDEDSLVETAEQRRWQELLGQVIAARTTIYSPALAASSVAARRHCNNAVIHERFEADDGSVRFEGSHISSFYDSLREHDPDDRIWAGLPALTGIVEGLRCLSEPEIVGLEAAYVEAVTKTMQDLLDRDKPVLAQVIWDQALPVELILFDAVKHFAKPQGWRMLQARIETNTVVVPEFPPDGHDFDSFYVEDSDTCSTIRCQLYKGSQRTTPAGQGLILDTLGAWLPDLTRREKLRRSSLHPHNLLDAMVNFELLGEGDCALIELNFFNRTCKSKRTCEFSDELAAMPNDLGLSVMPGQPGSPFTHLGTSRSELDTRNACGSDGGGGGSAPTTCFGPELRGHGGRFFPLDPELDRIMSCTLEVFDGPEPTVTPVVVDLDFDPSCLLLDPPDGGVEPPDDGGTPPDPEPKEDPPEVNEENVTTARDEAEGVLTGETRYGVSRAQLVAVLRSRFVRPGTPDSVIIEALEEAALTVGSGGPTLGRGRSGAPLELQTRWYSDGELGDALIAIDEGVFNGDLARIAERVPAEMVNAVAGEYMFIAFLHEGMHLAMHILSSQNHAKPVWDMQATHHDITSALGLNRIYGRSCDPNDNNCRSGCGYADARIQRFSECLAAGDPTPIDRCEFAIDYCTTRSEGNLHFDGGTGCGAPTISFPSMCAAVTCDTGTDLASACCGGGGGGTPPTFYGYESPDPGPYPGDPDGTGGFPSGPGGIPFPPLPPGY